MKKISYILTTLLLFIIGINNVSAKIEHPKIYLFHLTGCPHCAEAREYIRSVLMEEFPELELVQYEVGSKENSEFLDKIQSVNGAYSNSVPYIFIGPFSSIGFNSEIKNNLYDATKNYIITGIEFNVPELVKNGTLTSDNYYRYTTDYNNKSVEILKNYKEPDEEEIVEEVISTEKNEKDFPYNLIIYSGLGFVVIIIAIILIKKSR